MRLPAFQGLLIPLLLTMVVAGGGVGCAMNPVSGTPDFVFMSDSSVIDSKYILRLINDKFPDGEPQAGELIKIIE